MRDRILIKRNVLEIKGAPCENAAAYGAKLLNQFGVIVDKPKYLSAVNLETVASFYGTEIPEGFYKNPQHLQYFSGDELLIEQLVSYFTVEICGERSLNPEVFTRKPVFKKALPNYEEGKEIKVRYYRMLTESECDETLCDIALDFCNYTRKWSAEESSEFYWLYSNGYYRGEKMKCKDNAIEMFLTTKNKIFACMLDKKDVVKMSVEKFGDTKFLVITDGNKVYFNIAASCARDCPLTKKQAKYFNTIAKKVGLHAPKATNENSAYKQALSKLNSGDVLGAARTFSQNGSLLERNLVFLLSRANSEEAQKIIDMVKNDNPVALIQLLYGLNLDGERVKRVFSFVKNRKFKTHEETDYEFTYRKSVLSADVKEILRQSLYAKIRAYYSDKPSLGKIYVSPQFKNVALPLNTSAMGMGLDVLPTGSRLPIKGDYLRTFCYWKKAFDIDASVIFIAEDGQTACLYWGNYSQEEFGESVLCSGDNRSANGAEYCDFKIDEVLKLGYKYAVYCLNGYGSTLDEGEIYCGYQDKANLKTRAWSAKNMEFKIRVKGKTRSYIGFAFDLEKRQTVVLNRMLNGDNRVVDESSIDCITSFLDGRFLKTFSAYDLITMRGELVGDPREADVVFDSDYLPIDGQKAVRPSDIEKLVNLLK